MMRNWFLSVIVVLLLLVTAACAPKLDSAGKRLGDPTGRVINTGLSCVGYCSGYAASGNEWCFCDAPCEENGNCCSDFQTACPEVTG